VIVAFIIAPSPNTSTAWDSVIARDFRLSAWFTGLHLAIPAILVNKDLMCWLQPCCASSISHVDGIHGEEVWGEEH
jgi:hypothetical protein